MELSLESIFGLVIGAIILLVIGSVIVSLIWSPAEIDDATLSSFDEIARVIRAVEEKGSYKENIFLDINEPFIIVGFTKGELVKSPGAGKYMRGMGDINNLSSPCSGKACLCICAFNPITIGAAISISKNNDCFKYKEKCIIFDKIDSLKGPSRLSGEFIFFPKDKSKYFLLEGSKNVVSLK